MPGVLITSDTMACKVGQGTVGVSGASKLVVSGTAVLTADGVNGKEVTGCAPPGSPPPPPCTKASLLTGQSTKLFVAGSPVLLAQTTAQGAATPPHPIGPVSASQTKLVAL